MEPAAARWRSESDSTYLLKQLDLTPAARRAGGADNVNLNACKGRAVQVYPPELIPGLPQVHPSFTPASPQLHLRFTPV